MSPSRRSAPGSLSWAIWSRPGLTSRPAGIAPLFLASTKVRPEPQPTSSRRVPLVIAAASRTASNSGWLWASASSAQARGSVPHSRRWTCAAALRFIVCSLPQGLEAGVHAVDDVVAAVDFDRVGEQRAAVVPGDVDGTRAGGVDQAAAQPGQAGAFFGYVGHHPGHVADRARDRVERGRQAVVDGVDLVELDDGRTPGGERGRVVEHDVMVFLGADGQRELLERHVLDDVEGTDAQVALPLLHRGVQVIDPVADVVQARHRAWSRPWSAPPPNCRSWSMVIRMNG